MVYNLRKMTRSYKNTISTFVPQRLRIIISTKPPQEYKEFLKVKEGSGNIADLLHTGSLRRIDSNAHNQNGSGNLAADTGSLRRIDSNADESDGKVCNITVLSRHAPMI